MHAVRLPHAQVLMNLSQETPPDDECSINDRRAAGNALPPELAGVKQPGSGPCLSVHLCEGSIFCEVRSYRPPSRVRVKRVKSGSAAQTAQRFGEHPLRDTLCRGLAFCPTARAGQQLLALPGRIQGCHARTNRSTCTLLERGSWCCLVVVWSHSQHDVLEGSIVHSESVQNGHKSCRNDGATHHGRRADEP